LEEDGKSIRLQVLKCILN